jgi:hypothetical protein
MGQGICEMLAQEPSIIIRSICNNMTVLVGLFSYDQLIEKRCKTLIMTLFIYFKCFVLLKDATFMGMERLVWHHRCLIKTSL